MLLLLRIEVPKKKRRRNYCSSLALFDFGPFGLSGFSQRLISFLVHMHGSLLLCDMSRHSTHTAHSSLLVNNVTNIPASLLAHDVLI